MTSFQHDRELDRRLDESVDPDPAVRAQACQHLARLGDARVVPTLVDCLQDDSPTVRRAARGALEILSHTHGAPLAQAVIHWSPAVRIAGCKAAGLHDSSRLRDRVVRLLADPMPAVRAAAAATLERLGEGLIVNTVERMQAGDVSAQADLQRLLEQGDVRALEALSRWRVHDIESSPGSWRWLRSMLERCWRWVTGAGPPPAEVVDEALRSLGTRAVEGFCERMRNVDPETRGAAREGLVRICELMRPELSRLLCRPCLRRCDERRVTIGKATVSVITCRECRRSAELLRDIRQVVVVLDAATAPFVVRDGVARVNWFARPSPLDFDRVEMVTATDREVESFCIAIGNDTLWRGDHQGTTAVSIAESCSLSPATLRMLEESFGELQFTAAEDRALV